MKYFEKNLPWCHYVHHEFLEFNPVFGGKLPAFARAMARI
jgi:hypothetical protein